MRISNGSSSPTTSPDPSSSSLVPRYSPATTIDSDGISLSKTETNGCTTNGTATNGIAPPQIARVQPPWPSLYKDSPIDREEFVRLVVQSLRDVGYTESARTLEAESGYTLESGIVAEFRRAVIEGEWEELEAALLQLGVQNEDDLQTTRFLISQQKYLELLEARQLTAALYVLRNELAPLNYDSDRLHLLSSLMMCSEEDLLSNAKWDGARGSSRQQLLADLQLYQRNACLYHNTTAPLSLYSDHECDRTQFPSLTTYILAEHADEVWHIKWSHDGRYLASASKDKSAIVWRIGPPSESGNRDCTPEQVFRDHKYEVSCLAWSLDDSILLTSAENIVKIWNVKSGVCIREVDSRVGPDPCPVSSLQWLPDNSGFVSGSMDRRIIFWDRDGKRTDTWGPTSIRITDMAISPDGSRLVATGMLHNPALASATPSTSSLNLPNGTSSNPSTLTKRIVIYDMHTKQEEASIPQSGELTSVQISSDSQYALINRSVDEVHLWDLNSKRMVRRYMGHQQFRHVIRSCFGGANESFIVSGSEDGKVYIWHRDSCALLEALPGHGQGSVNTVAWNPQDEGMFASCSDDCTIRIWEALPPGYTRDVESTSEGQEPWRSNSNGASWRTNGGSGTDMID
ncbi:hypothetical protein BOTBODRAFT_120606 [Botryobasidium botryosum FD-172 SS1]|uniref:CTLH domain-containing protein n=1 Tax=Botryobasidium botryosum (strain FD-172 SS1) TaxID=930990 RepID=A0A067LVA2_BOTB1|nr:hypothetical protein BOTBODRAFT_120606 [Botryobasidium botryosum FD-172 SS1]